jgi:Bacterial SCP ortholog
VPSRRRAISPDRLRAAAEAQALRLGVVQVPDDLDGLARLVLHALDPGVADDDALRVATRGLLDRLAERAPGSAVEVRVPPYAAVQCIGGVRHTRGTPPAVVETDAPTFLRLSAGQLRWTDAIRTGTVTASGERSDLSPYLPLVEISEDEQ